MLSVSTTGGSDSPLVDSESSANKLVGGKLAVTGFSSNLQTTDSPTTRSALFFSTSMKITVLEPRISSSNWRKGGASELGQYTPPTRPLSHHHVQTMSNLKPSPTTAAGPSSPPASSNPSILAVYSSSPLSAALSTGLVATGLAPIRLGDEASGWLK